ncbi:intraflagellar transport protein 43 homolog [Watersipora subatra]|uniref:intraflagellar transport protein 43 homolog n=1 Tax=Watersipora subatra TaxID=2589382 RepID=UPI00355B3933
MDDIDFDDTITKKASARKGRRARDADIDDIINDALPSNKTPQADKSPKSGRPAMRKGGWGDDDELDAGASSKSKSGRRRGEHVEETINTGFSKFDDDDDGSDNDIPVIPDLEETVTEDHSAQIAIAPSVAVNKVTSYQDLDKDLQRTAQFSMMDGDVDLKLLTRHLVSEADTVEDDKMWHWDHLFTEISSELQTEWDANDADNAELMVS